MNDLRISLDDRLQAALTTLQASMQAKADEWGGVVTPEMVVRALILQATPALTTPTASPTTPTAASRVILPPLPQFSPPTASPTPPTASSEVFLGDGGLLGGQNARQTGVPGQDPPPNWAETAYFPPGEKEMDAWYKARGWKRYVAGSPRGPVTLYWASVGMYRPLCAEPYDGGLGVVEVSGYGLVHVVPEGWAARGADGAEVREAGTTPTLRASMGTGLPGKATVLS